ncbi:ATP-binding protein [Vibrio sp. TRT 17S01]|uniref:ATP-binding protein n=1 Tax=Vibrio sp. TRT 17S01 TaxID=3418505 RepID=UPI003CED5DF4
MSRFAEDSLSKKILTLFIITTSVLILQGIYNIYSLGDVNDSIKKVYDSVEQVNENNIELTGPVSELRQLTMFLVMAPDADTKETIKKDIQIDIEKIERTLSNYRTQAGTDTKANTLARNIENAWESYYETVLKTIYYSEKNIRIAEFMHVATDAKESYEEMLEEIAHFNQHLVERSNLIYAHAESSSKVAFWAVIITTVTEALILKLILFYVLSIVKKRLDERKAYSMELMEKNSQLENNIHQLQTIQGQLIEAEKQASLSKLVAGVAHEINTPIGIGITTSTHLVKLTNTVENKVATNKLTKQDLTDFFSSSKDITSILISNLSRAADIIQRFKRLSSDNIQSLEEKLNIGSKIKDTIMALSPNMKDIDIQMDNIQDIEVKTDSGAIYHTISNLVLNAKNHAFEDIEKPKVVIRMEEFEHDKVVITVSDNGKGMNQDILGKIFDPFFSTAKENGGTGLGLSIVYNVLARINGSIKCDSQPGKGTMFTIEIPGPAKLIEDA